MSKRVKWIDAAKGILIILVVLGHSDVNTATDMAINSFHMAGFFMLSGFTFHATAKLGEFIIKKVKSLLLPYIVFSVIMLLYQFAKTIVFNGYSFDLLSGLISVVIPISGRASTTVYGLWFLPCLFMAEIVVYGLIRLKQNSFYQAVIGFFVLCAVCFVVYEMSSVASVISILPIAVLFLIIGAALRNKAELLEKNKVWLSAVSAVLFTGAVLANYFMRGHTVDLSSMTLGVWPLYFASSFFGSILVCETAMLLTKIKVFTVLGKDSLYYYGLHYEALGVFGKIFRYGVLQTVLTFIVLYPVILFYKRAKGALRGKE